MAHTNPACLQWPAARINARITVSTPAPERLTYAPAKHIGTDRLVGGCEA